MMDKDKRVQGIIDYLEEEGVLDLRKFPWDK